MRWHVNVLQAFQAERPKYGLSESVLIYGDMLFCCPGGSAGYVVALDKHSGKTLWANKDLQDDIGYCSPVVAEVDGIQQVVTMSAKNVFAFTPDNGHILWQHPFSNARGNNATDVVVSDGRIYVSSGYGGGSMLLQPQRSSHETFSVKAVWKSDLLDNHHGGVLLLEGYLYGAGHEARGWFCLDFKTGQPRWQAKGKGSLTYADGMLYCLDERGTMSLVKATPEKRHEVGSFALPKGGKGLYWAHPVVCGGRLYVRHSEQMFTYDIRRD